MWRLKNKKINKQKVSEPPEGSDGGGEVQPSSCPWASDKGTGESQHSKEQDSSSDLGPGLRSTQTATAASGSIGSGWESQPSVTLGEGAAASGKEPRVLVDVLHGHWKGKYVAKVLGMTSEGLQVHYFHYDDYVEMLPWSNINRNSSKYRVQDFDQDVDSEGVVAYAVRTGLANCCHSSISIHHEESALGSSCSAQVPFHGGDEGKIVCSFSPARQIIDLDKLYREVRAHRCKIPRAEERFPKVQKLAECLRNASTVHGRELPQEWCIGARQECQRTRTALREAQMAVRVGLSDVNSTPNNLPKAIEVRNTMRLHHMEKIKDFVSRKAKVAEQVDMLATMHASIQSARKAVASAPATECLFRKGLHLNIAESDCTCVAAVAEYAKWKDSMDGERIASLTDSAVSALRDEFREMPLFDVESQHEVGCYHDAHVRLNDLSSDAVQKVNAEGAFWLQDPLESIPLAILWTASQKYEELLRLEHEELSDVLHCLEMELTPEIQELDQVLQLCPQTQKQALQKARQDLKYAKRRLRDRVQSMEDLREDGASKEALEDAKLQLSEARGRLKEADGVVSAAIRALMELEWHYPEVTESLAIGLPHELLPLWHPGRTLKEFTELTLLGGQSRNRVYLAKLKEKPFAIKEFPIMQSELQTCLREARLLHRLRHPMVVQIEAIFFEEGTGSSPGRFCIQMPFYSNGPLDEWIKASQPDADAIRRVMLGVLQALAHLHAHKIIHADVKPKNILIDSAGQPRLADFDISIDTATRLTVEHTCTRIGGTLGFAAPELDHCGPSAAADIFAFGATLDAVVCKQNRSHEFCSLVQQLMHENPGQRPSALEAAEHPYFVAVWNWQREEMRTCVVCFEQHALRNGVDCAGSTSGAHFLCDTCLVAHVKTETRKELRLLKAYDGRICCPVPECTAVPYADGDLARMLPADLFSKFLGCRQRLLEERLAREMEAQMQSQLKIELRRLASMDEQQRHVLQAAGYIREEILTLKCPRPDCRQAFIDFSGCFALTCTRCQCAFCAWCLADCGTNAHDHVRACPHKLASANFHGSIQEFNRAQKMRRERLLQGYLQSIPGDIRPGVIASINRDLQDLGLEV